MSGIRNTIRGTSSLLSFLLGTVPTLGCFSTPFCSNFGSELLLHPGPFFHLPDKALAPTFPDPAVLVEDGHVGGLVDHAF